MLPAWTGNRAAIGLLSRRHLLGRGIETEGHRSDLAGGQNHRPRLLLRLAVADYLARTTYL